MISTILGIFIYNYTSLPQGSRFADITKTISDSFLNRYDSGYSNYKKLYDVTIAYDYKFTKINSEYSDFSKFYIDSSEFALSKDNSSHTFSDTFEFDSTSDNGFDLMFNVSNGLLELDNMNYTMI